MCWNFSHLRFSYRCLSWARFTFAVLSLCRRAVFFSVLSYSFAVHCLNEFAVSKTTAIFLHFLTYLTALCFRPLFSNSTKNHSWDLRLFAAAIFGSSMFTPISIKFVGSRLSYVLEYANRPTLPLILERFVSNVQFSFCGFLFAVSYIVAIRCSGLPVGGSEHPRPTKKTNTLAHSPLPALFRSARANKYFLWQTDPKRSRVDRKEL